MAKTGYKIDYIVRDLGSDLSDLEAIHQEVFPNNKLAKWETKDKVIVKVSNFNKASGYTLDNCKKQVNFPKPEVRTR
jgi:hypothetical protein